ncbi:unnamed protein product [Protopolystoma xenopodis]|uniref:Uncharacterized protein n=1 Tax=Protopolystoma xenopodis TaxID=117903 RepID=A0A448XH20_9PLAT|nr:unnamed protein product [Protopolystoma xenopodis]
MFFFTLSSFAVSNHACVTPVRTRPVMPGSGLLRCSSLLSTAHQQTPKGLRASTRLVDTAASPLPSGDFIDLGASGLIDSYTSRSPMFNGRPISSLRGILASGGLEWDCFEAGMLSPTTDPEETRPPLGSCLDEQVPFTSECFPLPSMLPNRYSLAPSAAPSSLPPLPSNSISPTPPPSVSSVAHAISSASASLTAHATVSATCKGMQRCSDNGPARCTRGLRLGHTGAATNGLFATRTPKGKNAAVLMNDGKTAYLNFIFPTSTASGVLINCKKIVHPLLLGPWRIIL